MFGAGLALWIAILAAPQEPSDFGFDGLEIYKTDFDTRNLQTADFDGDGLMDFAFANNQRATLDLYLQKTREQFETDRRTPASFDDVNEIPSDARFRKEPLLTEKKIFCFRAGDLDSDGRPDLVYYGDPRELVVRYRRETGYDPPRAFDISDGSPSSDSIVVADLNADGRADLALLGGSRTYLFLQDEKGKLAPPKELPNSEKDIAWMDAGDLDGDGLADLVYVKPSASPPLRVRFQKKDGLGPEVLLELAAPRAFLLSDIDGDKACEVLSVGDVAGRAQIHRLARAAGEDFGSAHVFPLSPADRRRVIAVGDATRDGRIDVLVAYPDTSSICLYVQDDAGRLLPPQRFSTYSGITRIQVADADLDGKNEVLVVSPEEGAVGVSAWDGGRLSFPSPLVQVGKPFAFRFCPETAPPQLAVIADEGKGCQLHVWTRAEGGLQESSVTKIEKLKDDPSDLLARDLNGDGKPDFLVLTQNRPPVLLLSTPEGFRELDSDAVGGKGLLQGTRSQALDLADLDGNGKPELLAARKNFVRVLALEGGVFQALDQINARDAAADISGVSCADFDGAGPQEVVMADRAENEVHVMRRSENGVYEPLSTLRPPRMNLRETFAADLNGDGRPDVLAGGDETFVVFHAAADREEMALTASYAPDEKNARLEVLAVGRLDAGPAPQIVAINNTRHLFQIFRLKDGKELERALSFQVFEEKRANLGGVREVRIADVTGDGREDVLIMVHDRVLLYVQ